MSPSPSVPAKPGIVTAPSRSRRPAATCQNSSPSSRRASSGPAMVGGQTGSEPARGPSPRPVAPWQARQCCAYNEAPCVAVATENGAGDD